MYIRFSMYKLLTGILIPIWRMTGRKRLSAKNLKRKVIDEEIHDVRKKGKCIQDNIVYMNSEADKFSIVVEEKTDFTLLKRANDLRKLCNDKKSEIKKLEKMEEDLMIRMNAII